MTRGEKITVALSLRDWITLVMALVAAVSWIVHLEIAVREIPALKSDVTEIRARVLRYGPGAPEIPTDGRERR